MVRTLDELEQGGFLPSYSEVRSLIDSADATVDYCKMKNVIKYATECPRCKGCLKESKNDAMRCRKVDCAYTPATACQRCSGNMTLKHSEGEVIESNCGQCQWQWRPGLEYESSVFRGSLFQNCKVPKNEAFHCLWLWMHKIKSSTAAHMLLWHEDTVGRWHKFFRQVASQMTNNHVVGEGIQTGGLDDNGEPIIMEIDESKFGKRKCNRGRRVRANWVIGMVERTVQRRCVMVAAEKRDQSACTAIMRKHIKAGSKTFSDKWPGYFPIKKQYDKSYQHCDLCHKKEFMKKHDDGTVAHAQTIEGNWGGCKRDIPIHKRNGADLQDCLDEWMWRRTNAGELWSAMLTALATVRCGAPELMRANEVLDPWEQTDVLIDPNDCVDCDSNATSDTESDDDLEQMAPGTAARRARRRQVPVPEAVPSMQFREQEEQQALMEAALGAAAAAPTADGARGVI